MWEILLYWSPRVVFWVGYVWLLGVPLTFIYQLGLSSPVIDKRTYSEALVCAAYWHCEIFWGILAVVYFIPVTRKRKIGRGGGRGP